MYLQESEWTTKRTTKRSGPKSNEAGSPLRRRKANCSCCSTSSGLVGGSEMSEHECIDDEPFFSDEEFEDYDDTPVVREPLIREQILIAVLGETVAKKVRFTRDVWDARSEEH